MFTLKFNCAAANDPFLKQLHSSFKATPFLPPSSKDIDLLFLISHKGRETKVLGPLEEVLHDSDTPISVKTITSDVANIQLNKTSDISLELGLTVLSEVFQGFNLDMAPLRGAVAGGKELSLSFPDARRTRIFPTALGSALLNRKINPEHPLMKNVLKKKGLYVVTSLLQSRNFLMTFNKDRNTGLDFNAAVQQVADANLSVKSNRSTEFEIGHDGEEYLTFAFSCVELLVGKDGSISINREVIWKRGEDGQEVPVQDENYTEISFMNPELPAILAWDKDEQQ